jgi:hypothetical protein
MRALVLLLMLTLFVSCSKESYSEEEKELQKQFVKFESNVFEKYCLDNFDLNNDGKISLYEASFVISIRFVNEDDAKVSVKGLESFTNLQSLFLKGFIGDLDLSKNDKLTSLEVTSTDLEYIDVSKNTELTIFKCGNNKIKKLDISNNKKLTDFECDRNEISSLDISDFECLSMLSCVYNKINSISINNCKALGLVRMDNNCISDLSLTNCPNLNELFCSGNNLENIDLSSFHKLKILACMDNRLTSLNVSQCNQTLVLVAWPQESILEKLYRKWNQKLSFFTDYYLNKTVDISEYGTTLINLE